MKFKPSKIWYVIGALLAANIAAAAAARSQAADHATVYFFDVGQGDAIYIRTPRGNDVLIDGGPGNAVLAKLGQAMPFSDRRIELVILTHPHADHVSGLVEVLKKYDVEKVMVSEMSYDSATWRQFAGLLESEGADIIRPRLGQRVFLDDSAVMDVFYPVIGAFPVLPRDPNTVSTVARITVGKTSVLLTGDADRAIENFLLAAGLPLSSGILKVGHQGSRTSSGSEFLDAVGSEYAVISVGQNNYGHPHEEVLGVLAENSQQVLRTDEHGDIVFEVYPDRVLKK